MYEHGAPQYEAEYRVRHRNGSWIWVWHRALALRDEKGPYCGWWARFSTSRQGVMRRSI